MRGAAAEFGAKVVGWVEKGPQLLLKAVSVLLWRGNYKGLVHPLADF